jgi:hypothetical protein
VLYTTVDEGDVDWSYMGRPIIRARPYAEPKALNALVDAIAAARQPIIVSGSGVLWSHAWDEMRAFVEMAGIPFYTTPQGRGVVPDDHPYSYLTMRNDAFREADLIIILGTRTNYVIGHALPPRFGASAKVARIDIDPEEMGNSARNIDLPIVGDCKSVLQQLCEAIDARTADGFQPWRQKLADGEAQKRIRAGGNYPTDGDIHPLRFCEEVKNFMQREATLSVDGQEILNYGRQSIPTFVPDHRLNSGPFGTMDVGLPFAVGAKAAKPDAQVICLHGDGSFGQSAMELDTAVRHKLPLLCVISLNGGWTADPDRNKPGRDPWLHPLRQDGRGLGLLRRICRRARGDPPGLAACVEEGRGRHGRLRQRQDRLPRPRDDGALFEPRDLSGRPRVAEGAAAGALSTRRHAKNNEFRICTPEQRRCLETRFQILQLVRPQPVARKNNE